MIQKIQKTKLHEAVVKQIIEMISLGIYKYGEKLPSEKQLCESFGVSRVTMREALKQLAELEFIQTRQGMGSVVTVHSDDPRVSTQFSSSVAVMENNFRYTMQARLLLEPMIVFTLANTATDEELTMLKDKLMPILDSDDPAAFYLEDFHLAVAELLHNPLVLDFIAQLRALENDAPSRLPTLPEKNIEFRRRNNESHKRILAAMLDRQADLAYLYMKEHILYLKGEFDDFFQREYLPQ